MKAVVVDQTMPGNLKVAEIGEPSPSAAETLVRVTSFSLNRGEVRRAESAPDGTQIGWDFTGVVERQAQDSNGPPKGSRVVGFSRAMKGWAELVAVPPQDLAPIPNSVSDQDAATLPVAGLTALYCLERCNRLLASQVLVTGATGGVGYFACQLGRLMGANVTGLVRRAEQETIVRELDVDVLVTGNGDDLPEDLKFRAIIDGVGGALLGSLLPLLDPSGRAILYGVSGASETQLPIRALMFTGDGRIEGFHLYRETEVESAQKGLERLLRLVESGNLITHVSLQDEWANVGSVAENLISRSYTGKAVLKIQ